MYKWVAFAALILLACTSTPPDPTPRPTRTPEPTRIVPLLCSDGRVAQGLPRCIWPEGPTPTPTALPTPAPSCVHLPLEAHEVWRTIDRKAPFASATVVAAITENSDLHKNDALRLLNECLLQ